MSKTQVRVFGRASKPGKVKPAMTYCLNTQEPNTKYIGNFASMMQSDRWYKCVIKLHMCEEKESEQLDIITITHFSPYKTNIIEYGRQIQAIINEYLEYGFYDPNASHVRVCIGEPPTVTKLEHVVEEGNDFYNNLIDFLLRDKTYQLKKVNDTYYSVKTSDGRCAIALKLSDEKPYNGKVKVELVTLPALVQRYALALKTNKVLSIADKKNILTESETQISIPRYKAFVDYLNKHFDELKENK